MGRLLDLLKDVALKPDVRSEILAIDREHSVFKSKQPVASQELLAARDREMSLDRDNKKLQSQQKQATARIKQQAEEIEDLKERIHRLTQAPKEPEPATIEVPRILLALLETLWGLGDATASELAKSLGIRRKTAERHLADLRREKAVTVEKDEASGELRFKLMDRMREYLVHQAFGEVVGD